MGTARNRKRMEALTTENGIKTRNKAIFERLQRGKEQNKTVQKRKAGILRERIN